MTKKKSPTATLTLSGDYSIAGVSEQLPVLQQHLKETAAATEKAGNKALPCHIDLSDLQALEACGCQLLAIFLHKLRAKGLADFSFTMDEFQREQIHLFGFHTAIFTGDGHEQP